jgi:hypothetical protein
MLTLLKRLALAPLLLVALAAPSLAANSWYDFVTSEPSSSVSGGVNAAENMAPSQVNDAMRAWKQLEAGWLDDFGGIATVGGTSTAITVTLSQGFTAYGTGAGQIPNGAVIAIKTGSAATGATTLAVNGIATKAIRLNGDVAVQSGDWASGAILVLRYDTAANGAAGAWIVLDTAPMGYTGTGAVARATSPTFVTPALGTPASGTLTNTTGFPTANLAGAGAGVLTFLATPSSANLATAVTNETGSGALVFGTTPVFTTSIGIGATPVGGATLHMDASGSNYIRFNEGGTLRALIGVTAGSGGLITGDADNELIIRGDAGIKFGVGGAFALGIPDVGQLKFPATQNASSDANTLDDYSEGSWTPSLGGNATYTAQAGSYVKIGRLVRATGRIVVNAIGTGSTTVISGLPYTSAGAPQASIDIGYHLSTAANINEVVGYVNTSSTTIQLYHNATPGALGTTAFFQNGTELIFSATYLSAN